ncbi:hypothetical protein [Nocardioides zeicaulis]|uniref:Exo-alpha-sialidase n=1 Tax=Nocardioides zeicaulis TaxID=1776857 RepID=A0ABV6E1M1_9ACTN
MPTRRLTVPLLAVAALATTALAPTAAGAQDAPGGGAEAHPRAASAWTRVSTSTVSSLAEISALRSPDGVLHAFWKQDAGAQSALQHAALTDEGRPVSYATAAVLDSMAEVYPVNVTPTGGLRLTYAGLGAGPAGDGRAVDALSADGGASWATQPRALAKNSTAYTGYGIGSAQLPSGVPVTAVAIYGDTSYRVGSIDTTDPNLRNTATGDAVTTMPECCSYHQSVVTSGDTAWMAWYQNGTADSANGVFAQQVYPTAGPVMKAPGSSLDGSSSDHGQSMALVARPGGGVVLAYARGYLDPTVGLWDLTTGATANLRGSVEADRISLSATPSGRLWVGWTTQYGETVNLVRTAAKGFATGGVTSERLAFGSSLRAMALSGDEASAVVLLNDSDTEAVWSRSFGPSFSLAASRKKVVAGAGTKLTFKATDAGDGLKGVTVKAAGKACTTSGKGTCSITVTPGKGRKLAVRATRKGYQQAALTLKVVRRR